MNKQRKGQLAILLADDDPAVREAFRELLGMEGFTTIIEAETGLAALEILHQEVERLAFSVMDVDMPGMTGIEVLRTVGRERRVPPCIFISGNDSRSRQIQAMQAGAFSLLAKPVTPDLFRFSIKRLLDHYYYGQLP